jgi:hypothetical protein
MVLQFRAQFKGRNGDNYTMFTAISVYTQSSVFFEVFISVDEVSNCGVISIHILSNVREHKIWGHKQHTHG